MTPLQRIHWHDACISSVIESLELFLLNLKCWKLHNIILNKMFSLIKWWNGSFLVCHQLKSVAYNPNILCSDRTETNSPAHSSVLTHFESQRTCFCFLNSPWRLQTLVGINNNKHTARFEEGPSPCHKQPYITLYISDTLIIYLIAIDHQNIIIITRWRKLQDVFTIWSHCWRPTCHNTPSTPSIKRTVSINMSILIPHLQEPELWVHHVDASPVKTLKHGASNVASSSTTSQTQAAQVWSVDQKW